MSNYTIFNLSPQNDKEINEFINLDELFDKEQDHQLREYSIFKKLLHRIHIKIKITSKQKINEKFIWFIVPEFIIGYPKYDIATCISYLITVLRKNNFIVKYYKPNTLFIYWGHYYASYVRNEIKKKYGIIIDEFGNNKNIENSNIEFPLTKEQEIKEIKTLQKTGNKVYDEILSNLS